MAKSPDPAEVNFQGEITVPLEGVEYVLRPSYSAIMAIERQTGRSLFDLAGEATSGRMSIADMGVICAEMMHAFGRQNPDDSNITTYRGAKPEKIAELIYEAGGPRVSARIAVLLMGALTGGYTASGKMKATGTQTTEPTLVAE